MQQRLRHAARSASPEADLLTYSDMHILKIRHYGANGAAPIHLIHVRVRMSTDNKRTTMQHYTISLLEMPSKQLESRRRLSPGATCVTAVRAAPAAPGSPCIRNCLRSPSSTGSPNSEQHFGILNVPNPIRFPRVCTLCPDAADHSFAVPSLEAVSTCCPSGENTADRTTPLWPLRLRTTFSDSPDLSFAMLSRAGVNTCWPLGENTADQTARVKACRVRTHSPDAADHSFKLLSLEAVSTCCPSGKNMPHQTARVWPCRVSTHSPEATDWPSLGYLSQDVLSQNG